MKMKFIYLLPSVLAMVIVLSIIMGMCTSVIAQDPEENPESKPVIKYVSLGDSMVNGYGLTGYEYEYHYGDSRMTECLKQVCPLGNDCANQATCTYCHSTHAVHYWSNGYMQEVPDSYPVKFAAWLAGYNKIINSEKDTFDGSKAFVELSQMAVSAMRTEDLHWALEADWTDDEAMAVAGMSSWNEELWNATFTNGDKYTWSNFTKPGARWSSQLYPGVNLRDVIKAFQTEISEADIISVGIGNGNYGVFLMGRLMAAIGFDGQPEDTIEYTRIENAIRECSPNMQAELLLLRDTIYSSLEEYLGVELDDGNPDTTTMMEALANSIVYASVSYVLNYAGSIEAILKLNPDAEVMLVGIMNTFSGVDFSYTDENGVSQTVPMASLMNLIVAPVNTYIAALPAIMQETGNDTYKYAKFYYAEAPEVECMVDTYADTYKTQTVRDRLISSIVGNGNGMVWKLAKPMVQGMGFELVAINQDNVEEYETVLSHDSEALAAYIADCMENKNGKSINKLVSIVIYLGFEQAVVNAAAHPTIDLNSLTALADSENLGKVFAPLMAALTNPTIKDDTKEKVYGVITSMLNSNLINSVTTEDVEDLISGDLSVEAIVKKEVKSGFDALDPSLLPGLKALYSVSDIDGLVDAFILGGKDKINQFAEAGYLHPDNKEDLIDAYDAYIKGVTDINSAIAYVDMLCMLLEMPLLISDAAGTSPTLMGLLHMFGRCIVGKGLGANPSDKGHDELAKSLIKSYSEDHTALDQTIANLKVAYAAAYKQAKEKGSIDMLLGYIETAKGASKELALAAKAQKENIPEELLNAYELTIKELDNCYNTLDSLYNLVVNADRLDDDTWAALMEAVESLEAHKDLFTELARELKAVSDPYVSTAIEEINKIIDAVDFYTTLINSIIADAYNYAINGIVEFAEEYKAFVEEMGTYADKISPELGAAVRKFLTETPEDTLAILYAYGTAAVDKLLTDCAVAGDNIYNIVLALANLLYNNGENVVNAVKNNAQVQNIISKIQLKIQEIEELLAVAATTPVTFALTYDQSILLNTLRQDLYNLYEDLYKAVMSVVGIIDPVCAQMIDTSIQKILKVIGVTENTADSYIGYLEGSANEMAGMLLNAFLANLDELLRVACPTIDAIIIATIEAIEDYINTVVENIKTEINIQIVTLEKAIKDLKAELETISAEAREAIEAQITVLEAKVEELKAILIGGIKNVDDVIRAVKKVAEEVTLLAQQTKEAALETITTTLTDIKNALEELDAALANLGGDKYEFIKNTVTQLIDTIAQEIVAAVGKYLPQVADAIYAYLYNNPDTVINFVKTYGPYVLELAEEYGDEALAVVGYLIVICGEDIVKYVVENNKEIIANLTAWVEVHGENTAQLLQVYAEALGLCDAVREKIAILEETVKELKIAYEGVKAELKEQYDVAIIEIEKQIAILKVKLQELERALNDVIDEINTKVEEAKQEVQVVINEIKAEIVKLQEKVNTTIEEIKKQADEVINETVAELEKVLDTTINDMNDLVDALEAAVVEATDQIITLINEIIYKATHGVYVIDNDSYYVAIGDSSAYGDTYVELLAEMLDMKNQYNNIAIENATAKEILASMDKETIAEIMRADLITISMSNNTFTTFAVEQLFAAMTGRPVVEMDWNEYISEKGIEYIQEKLAEMNASFIESGMDESTAGIMTLAVESYAYAYVSYAFNYTKLAAIIGEVNPDALIVLVGMNNPFTGAVLNIDGTEFALGEYVQYLVDAANLQSFVMALINPNIVYVDASEAQNNMDPESLTDMWSLIAEILYFGSERLYVNGEGHVYIKDMIDNALEIIDNRGLLGDADSYGVVDMFDAALVLQYYTGEVTEDAIDLAVSDVDGDGAVNMFDASLILQYYTGEISLFPVEK